MQQNNKSSKFVGVISTWVGVEEFFILIFTKYKSYKNDFMALMF